MLGIALHMNATLSCRARHSAKQFHCLNLCLICTLHSHERCRRCLLPLRITSTEPLASMWFRTRLAGAGPSMARVIGGDLANFDLSQHTRANYKLLTIFFKSSCLQCLIFARAFVYHVTTTQRPVCVTPSLLKHFP